MSPHYEAHKTTAADFMPRPERPEPWRTGVRFWIRREGLVWGLYWAVRSRWINAVNDAAYKQRMAEWDRTP